MNERASTLAELRAAAEPIAARVVRLHQEIQQAQSELLALVLEQRSGALAAAERGATAQPAPHGYMGALLAYAELQSGMPAEHAADLAARQLGCEHLHNSAAALALPAERRLELMLTDRLEQELRGN